MRRRTILAGTGTILSTTLAGCLSNIADITGTADEDALYLISLDVTDVDQAASFDVEVDIEVRTETVTQTSPAEIHVSLTNHESEAITVSSGPGWPFGVITLEQDSPDDETIHVPFWSDRYGESPHIPDDAENVTATDGIAVNGEVGGGEKVESVYELHADAVNLEAGVYELTVSNALEEGERTDGQYLTAEVEITTAD